MDDTCKSRGMKHGTPVLAAAATSINFTGGDSFSRGIFLGGSICDGGRGGRYAALQPI